MTTKQKNGKWTGSYTDDDQTDWEWTCKVPPVNKQAGATSASKKWDTKANTWMEILIWITYISGAFWVFGYPIMFPLGLFVCIWTQIEYLLAFFDVLGGEDFMAWLFGPYRRAFLTVLIFEFGLMNTIIPVWSIVADPLLGWLAVANYYDFDYKLF